MRKKAILDRGMCHIKGLEGYRITKMVSEEEYVLSEDLIATLKIFIDRVFTPPEETFDLGMTIAIGPTKSFL